MKFIGIDIAKKTFVAAYPQLKGYQTQTYTNDVKGIKKFINSFIAAEYHCLLEATGNYGTLLLYMLCEQNIAVSLVNPKEVKHFARMMLTVTKTDDVDAKLIAMYGEKMTPPMYKMPTCERQLRIQGFWQLGIHNIRQECYIENGKNECIVRFKSNAIILRFKERLPVLQTMAFSS